jgi:hypothetical protein
MARARKEVEPIIEEQFTDIPKLMEYLDKLREQIPQEVRDSLPDDVLTNLDDYLYGLPENE